MSSLDPRPLEKEGLGFTVCEWVDSIVNFLVKLLVIYHNYSMYRINHETTEPVYGNHMVSPSSSTDQIWLSNTGQSVRKRRRE